MQASTTGARRPNDDGNGRIADRREPSTAPTTRLETAGGTAKYSRAAVRVGAIVATDYNSQKTMKRGLKVPLLLASVLALVFVLGWVALALARVASVDACMDSVRANVAALETLESAPEVAPQAEASSRELVATPASVAIPVSELRIAVIDGASKQPVPNARVWIARADVDSLAWEDALARHGGRAAALMHECGDEFSADERGELRVPRVVVDTRIHAASRELHGGGVAAPSDGECVIELQSIAVLDIEVVDVRGAAVPDVWVALLSGEDLSPVWTALTDGAGRASVLDLDELRSDASGRWRAGVSFGAAVPRFVDVDERASSWELERRRPIRFVLAETGAIEFQLVDEHGQPLALEAEFGLYVDDDRLDEPFALEEDAWHGRHTRDGRARFDHVALELPLAVHVWAIGFEFDEPDDLRGPASPGDTRQVELRRTGVLPIVRGRVLDPEGRAFATAWLTALIPEFDPTAQSKYDALRWDCWTDGNGAFETELRRSFPVLDEYELALMVSETNRATYVGRVRVPPLTAAVRDGWPPSYDFGDIVVAPLDVLVSGMVVDDHGAAIECARVEARDADTGRTIEADDDLRCETDQRGRFVVSGAARPARIALWAGYDGESDVVIADRGARDVRLVVRPRGRIAGRLLVPVGVDIDDFSLIFKDAAPRASPWKSPNLSYETFNDGRFITDREPGEWSFAVFDHESDEVLWRRDGLVVESRQRLDLGEIDLRPLLEARPKNE